MGLATSANVTFRHVSYKLVARDDVQSICYHHISLYAHNVIAMILSLVSSQAYA